MGDDVHVVELFGIGKAYDVGCSDSRNRHATAHFDATGHPIIQSLDPGAGWRWCHVDKMLVYGSSGGTDERSIPNAGR